MKYKIIDKIIVLSLKRGDFINASIKEIFEKENLTFGWIHGIGAVHNIEIGCYDLKKKGYIKKILSEQHELLSISGNITFVDSKHFVHTHVVLANQDFQSFGGHLFDAQISATGELKIDLLDYQIDRRLSDDIGLNLWYIE